MNIDRLARGYRWCEYAAFGRTLERRRYAFLDRASGASRVLIPGEGDGRALARLLAVAPDARIDVVELSGQMIELARRRIAGSERVHFVQQDALEASWPANSYDAVVTLFFLDCLDAVQARVLIDGLAKALVPGGIWLVSEFGVPERGWRKWHARIWLWIMYRFFRAVTGLRTRALPPIEKLLTRAGLRLVEREEERWGLVRSEVWRKDGVVSGSTLFDA